MPFISGVIASAESHGDTATLVVYRMVDEPVRHLAVDDPIVMTVVRQSWQEEDAVLEYVDYVVGRAGDIVYVDGPDGKIFDAFYTN